MLCKTYNKYSMFFIRLNKRNHHFRSNLFKRIDNALITRRIIIFVRNKRFKINYLESHLILLVLELHDNHVVLIKNKKIIIKHNKYYKSIIWRSLNGKWLITEIIYFSEITAANLWNISNKRVYTIIHYKKKWIWIILLRRNKFSFSFRMWWRNNELLEVTAI